MESLPVPGILKAEIVPQESLALCISLKHSVDLKTVNKALRVLINAMGLDLTSQHFVRTPERVTKMWSEFLAPRELTLTAFESKVSTQVLTRNHTTVTVCPHHMLPVEMHCSLAYIPNGWAVGLSKLPRLLDLIASSFMLQEELTETVVRLFDRLLNPKGVACRVVARHGCMRLRGVRTPGEVITTALAGVYLTDEKARSEFLSGLDSHVFNGDK